jgi:deazaflavin-dependent oxidoreductase (nitroreductase family)
VISRHRGRGVPARALNPLVGLLVGRLGVPVPGVRMLRVHGRRSGRLRSVPVTVTPLEGGRYLVGVRGETDWSRNLESAGWGELIRGSSVERVRAARVDGEEACHALSGHVRLHGWATRRLLGAGRNPNAEQLDAIASRVPVFRISTWDSEHRGN